MMKRILRRFFPFAITVTLWYLSAPRFNPFGILALIPVFYYRFRRPAEYWFPFGLLMCFLMDFNAGTLFLFSSVFLLTDLLNVFFGILEKEGDSGFYVKSFSMFIGLAALFALVCGIFETRRFFAFFAGSVWLYLWLLILYFPFVALFKWVGNDR
ncbi:MAG: hypothetical protein LBL21_00125 [Rickettsiales bacterium]|nr:hypothetical protein [Rickettsiales bacterium]